MNQSTIHAPKMGSVKGTKARQIAIIPAMILRARDHPGRSLEKIPLNSELMPRKSKPIPNIRIIP